MANIEKALRWAETLIQQTDEHLPCCSDALKIELVEQREFAVTAIYALQEKLARERGCEFCDEKIYEELDESTVEWLELELVNNSLMVGVKLPMYEYSKSEFFIQFCPMCGKGVKRD